ncbi:App1 family protein [Microbacterium sp. SLBN-146]|uniref:App1 family protein n=1 Tax=Microbacterium sp. SLBN-146 TaxID=2768457 RepID=UPI00114F050D|nr:phosphatase domain-containing protein [Microbacterium sp. SLBN-146]TQJ32057.1 phosphatidate phosphatase APP1 [Microbacterium sp. SLBN-146]
MPDNTDAPARTKVLWLARLEHRFHTWRERRARARGLTPTVTPFPGYGSTEWVRVLGRVLIVPVVKPRSPGEYASVRGWRSFAAVPVGYAQVSITIAGVTHDVVSDRGGVIDAVIPAELDPGWQTFTVTVEGSEPVETRAFIVAPDLRFGVVSDVDDTVMVTALPRPLIAAWNSFVVDEHARQPVPGMAVLMERLVRDNPGSPLIYLSTGAWNVAPTLIRFLRRHLFPPGAMLLTDWGPTHDRWFRSGRDHKAENLRRLAREFPDVRWLLIGDDGQHDDDLYTTFTSEHPGNVVAVAIRQLSPTEAVLAGGRTAVNDHSAAAIPWVTDKDGAGLLERLEEAGVIGR